MVKSKTEQRVIDGISYRLERKRITRLHLYIKPPDGSVLVTAPFLIPQREIDSFIRDRADWIRKHVQRFSERPLQSKMALEYETGETLYFWGKPYTLRVISEKGRTRGKVDLRPEPSFDVTDEELEDFVAQSFGMLKPGWTAFDDAEEPGEVILTVPEGSTAAQRESIVRRKYKALLEEEAGRILDFWSDKTGLRYASWHSRLMKSRWGSLTIQDRKVCLTTRLAEKPEICLIYVALHEVAHVKEANHGPRFKAILTEHMPSWREAEKILKQ